MKRNIFLLVSTAVLVMIFSAFTGFTGSTGNENHQVVLVKRSGGTRSSATTEVTAFISDDHSLTVEIKDYTGMVWVDITGTGDALHQAVQVNASGFIETDISTLPQGSYLLSVTLENGLYEGYFER